MRFMLWRSATTLSWLVFWWFPVHLPSVSGTVNTTFASAGSTVDFAASSHHFSIFQVTTKYICLDGSIVSATPSFRLTLSPVMTCCCCCRSSFSHAVISAGWVSSCCSCIMALVCNMLSFVWVGVCRRLQGSYATFIKYSDYIFLYLVLKLAFCFHEGIGVAK